MFERILLLSALLGATIVPLVGGAEAPNGSFPTPHPATDTMIAAGTFDVEITPVTSDEGEGATLGRMSMAREFRGDLEGTSTGEMLTATTPVETSGGYVAMERVIGTLHGRRGTFVLQHSGTMQGGEQWLEITVVPDSGTGDLEGIEGTFGVTIEDAVHVYELRYTLPPREG